MLPKLKRLSTKTVSIVLEKGKSFHTPFFILKGISTLKISRFSVSVPKKVAKTAVSRNTLHRQIYSLIKEMESRIKQGIDIFIVLKSGSEKLSFDEMRSELEKLFVKSGVLK